MIDAETLKYVLLQLPNFVGFVIALWIQYRHNQDLLSLLRDCNEEINSTKVQVD